MPSPSNRPVALVTGASRGLGFLLAREFADRGYDLVICARSADGLDIAADDLRGHGATVHDMALDVGDESAAGHLVAETERVFGRLDVLVANAGIIQVGPYAELTAADYREAMDTMFWGQVYPVLAALPLLRRSQGRVLAITSLGGKVPAPHLLPYGAAKHAAVGFAEGLRVEGVPVTVAVPGLMRTGSTRNALFTGDRTAERTWFTVAGSLPVLSMDAERAAGRLVRATLRGRPEVTLTLPAKVAVRAHALAPGLSLRALSLVNRLLPGPVGAGGPEPGHTATPSSSWFRRLTRRDRDAARRWHENDDPATA
jgi:NAD(P)-dependent dehydrogenase (short-subunit alcohol dehydrogenase family)